MKRISKFNGVLWTGEAWIARMSNTTLGKFRTEVEAARAYDDAVRKSGDSFRVLNFPAVKEEQDVA